MKHALIIVDVQNDFCEGGSLAVAGGAKVARDISSFIDLYGGAYDLIVATRDWHNAPPDDNFGHFALDAEPDYVNTWPVHCVAHTPGAEYHPDLVLPDRTVEIFKGDGEAAYSGFEGKTLYGTSLLNILKSLDIRSMDIVGIATDFCVAQTALDAVRSGYRDRTWILADLTAAVSTSTLLSVMPIFSSNGIRLVNSQHISKDYYE